MTSERISHIECDHVSIRKWEYDNGLTEYTLYIHIENDGIICKISKRIAEEILTKIIENEKKLSSIEI